jgi:hypothetical protein
LLSLDSSLNAEDRELLRAPFVLIKLMRIHFLDRAITFPRLPRRKTQRNHRTINHNDWEYLSTIGNICREP